MRRGSRPDNVYRLIDNLAKLPSDQAMYYGTQEHKIRQLQSHAGQCTEKLDEMTLEYMKLKTQFEDSNEKLQTTEKALRDITNQRDVIKRSRVYTKARLLTSEKKLESLQKDYTDVLIENTDLSDVLSEKDEEDLQSLIPPVC